ncbi:hypothetical protein HPB49_003897 [Dermacentor silvarum]|uniref:Uncharacterized protein n=1 Tax=Dermacentor silvarum TaxID=543639 RepID=A0ACB8DMK7_DERSI|nr:hypothetical protein HPB49_003897 [Dermacentor silvarum]
MRTLDIKRVLGVAWSKATDAFIYNPENIFTFLEKANDTQRFVTQTVSRIYARLECLTPYVVRGKMLFRQLWVSKADWNEDLPDHIAEKWHNWRNELIHLSKVNVSCPLMSGVPNRVTFSYMFSSTQAQKHTELLYTFV